MQSSAHSHPRNTLLSWTLDLLGAALLVGLFYALWMGHHALFTPDEGRYPEIAREMVATGDYITPRLNGVVFLDKPALYYWLQASAIRLFGLKEWAIRLWPMLFGVAGAVATLATGRLLFNRRTGWLAAIMLASCPLYYGAAHYANLDLEVAILISLTLFSVLLADRQPAGTARSLLFFSVWIFAALAFLTKGLIALAFPVMITGLWLLLSGNKWRLLTEVHWLKGPALFLAIVLPWYWLVQKANPGFLHFFFVTQQVSRFLSQQDFNNQSPFWFYLPVVFAGFFPWIVFSLQGIVAAFRQSGFRNSRGFLLIWFLVVLVFFSLPRSKTIGYILPTLPPLALLTACYLDGLWDDKTLKHIRLSLWLFWALAFTVIPGVCIGAWLQNAPLWPWMIATASVFVLTGLWLVFLARDMKKTRISTACMGLLVASLVFLLIFLGSASTLNQDSLKPLALSIKASIKPGDEIVTWYKYWQDLPVYLEKRITAVSDWHAPDIPLRDNWVRELWYGMAFQDTSDWLISEKTFWERWNSSKRIYVLVDKNRLHLFRAHAGSATIIEKGEYNDVLWLTNHQ